MKQEMKVGLKENSVNFTKQLKLKQNFSSLRNVKLTILTTLQCFCFGQSVNFH